MFLYTKIIANKISRTAFILKIISLQAFAGVTNE